MAQQSDVIIIGAGLTGLGLANGLIERGKSILLIDGESEVGSIHRGVSWRDQKIENGLRLLTDDEQTRGFLRTAGLAAERAEPLTISTFHAHEERNFLGFGSEQPAAYDQYRYFLNAAENHLSINLFDVVEKFRNLIPPENIILKSHVTSLLVEEGQVKGVVVNHAQKFRAAKVILTGSPLQILELLPNEIIPVRVKQKLGKLKTFSCLCLDYLTTDTTAALTAKSYLLHTVSSEDPIILFGVQKGTLWQWVSFFSETAAEDTEALGTLVKKAKRQIKRAFPAFYDSKPAERVCLFENLGAEQAIELPTEPLEGLILASPLFAKESVILNAAFDVISATMAMHFSVAQEQPNESV